LVGTYKYSDTQVRFEASRSHKQLDEAVLTVGMRSGAELWQEYADADIFFFPTFYEAETFGVVALEAMAHRLPVVASSWRGPGDIVRDGETGILCKPHDILSYAKAIRRLMEDGELRNRMGCNGQIVCNKEYSLSQYLSSMEKIFEKANCRPKSS
jgi:glycosyltransferase involved in cell wall biosynthesis